MDKKDKVKEVKISMVSEDEVVIKSVVELIRKEGDIDYYPAIIHGLKHNPSESNKLIISGLLNDLKVASMAPIIMDSIRAEKDTNTLRYLISSCWQNRLDFSAYLDDFVRFFLHKDIQLAIESFTVIETIIDEYSIEKNIIEKCINQMKEDINNHEESRQFLILDLIKRMEEL